MVKNKRDIVTPRKRAALTQKQRVLDRTITKVLSRPNSTTQKKEGKTTANIKVVIRVRPPNKYEDGENFRQVVKVVEDGMLIFDPDERTEGFFFHGVQQKGRDLLKKAKKNMKFYFDRIYPPDSANNDVFEGTTLSLINNIMDGYNCSVFAYGATGAGKTFTMTGTSTNPGITFLTMTQLFKKQEELSNERDFELGITYLEVYNELVKDLLNPGPPLNLREDSNYGVIVAGIKIFKISSADQLFALLQQGNINRTQHPTDANAESSRSHAVFQVYLKMTIKLTKEVRTAKLSMIDLAGSERGSATGFVGARFTEGANINKSLLALGNCINSLADGHRHVPYRDSKLTRLLKDCLGGNCQTVMIANISPSSLSFDDTYNTLKYATRANSIKASIHRNVAKADLNVMQYIKLVEELTKENHTVKKNFQEQKEKNDSLEKECVRLKEQMEDFAGKGCIVNETLVNEIKALAQQKIDLLDRRFQLEKHESSTTLRRLLKEEIDNRLSDICNNTPEKKVVRDKINSTILRFKKQQTALRDDIEKAEDNTDEIDKRFEELEMQHPHCKQFIISERLKLDLHRAQQRILLEQRHCQLLVEDQEEKVELMEKMATTLRSCFKILQGHGYATPNISKQYKDIVQVLQGRKNIKWNEIPDSGISSMSSIQDDQERKFIQNTNLSSTTLDKTFSTSTPSLLVLNTDKPKSKTSKEPLMPTGSQVLVSSNKIGKKSPFLVKKPLKILSKSPKVSTKSPKNNENLNRQPLAGTKPVKQYGTKAFLKSRPVPLRENPRFRR